MIYRKKRQKMNLKSFYTHKSFVPKIAKSLNESLQVGIQSYLIKILYRLPPGSEKNCKVFLGLKTNSLLNP